MWTDFLHPVNIEFDETFLQDKNLLGNQIQIHTQEEFPDLSSVKVAVLGVLENRRSNLQSDFDAYPFQEIRQKFYQLYAGNWGFHIADLGNIHPGNSVDDTYFALKSIVSELVKNEIIPIILGGSQDLVYANYRAYDDFGKMVNYVNVDTKFDLGNTEAPISSSSYVGRMVIDQPYNLYNFSNVGYQTFYNSQEEINLLEKLYFDAMRLGEATSQIEKTEPIFRNADIVGIDINTIESFQEKNTIGNPNGFTNREICRIARYAGISDQLSSFGLYHLENLQNSENSIMLVAQILWYFLEGVAYRKNENTAQAQKDFTKYKVLIENEVLTFCKSEISGRWWIEIPIFNNFNNNLDKTTLLPCTHQDYLDACNQNIPERWWKAQRKNEV